MLSRTCSLTFGLFVAIIGRADAAGCEAPSPGGRLKYWILVEVPAGSNRDVPRGAPSMFLARAKLIKVMVVGRSYK